MFEQRNGHTTGGYKLRSVLASSARCSAFGTFCSASTLRKTSCSRESLGAISLQRSELLKSMVRTVLIIVVVECFGSCFPSSWFEVFGKDRFSLSQLVPIIKVFDFMVLRKERNNREKWRKGQLFAKTFLIDEGLRFASFKFNVVVK